MLRHLGGDRFEVHSADPKTRPQGERCPVFSNLAQWIEHIIITLGPLGLAALMFLENIFPPIPSELVLPLAGFFIYRGDLEFAWALVAATAGSLLGAFVFYGLGRWGGRPLILRHRRLLRVNEADLDRADDWFDRYGGWVVFFGRMVPGIRSLVSIPAGISEMPLGRFSVLTALGSALWNTLLISAGWLLGENWHRVSGLVGSVSNIIFVALAVAAVVIAVWWWQTRRGTSA